MIKLFVDDDRVAPPDDWYVVRDAKTAIRYLFSNDVDLVSLDHDLGEGRSGYWIACEIESRVYYSDNYTPPRIVVHSANPVGRRNIEMCVASINRMLANR